MAIAAGGTAVGVATRRLAALALMLAGPAAAPAHAIPKLDLGPYAPPGPGERRWVIQLPGVLRSSEDPSIATDPADWRVQLLVGRNLNVDCNLQRLSGALQPQPLPGWGTTVYRVVGAGPGISTRMACPPGQPVRQAFVPLAGEPFLVPYNASLPIVVYAPRDLEVRWRLWKAGIEVHNANPL